MMKKIYMQPNMRTIEIDTQNLIAESPEVIKNEEVYVDGDDIVSLSRDNNNLWDQEW